MTTSFAVLQPGQRDYPERLAVLAVAPTIEVRGAPPGSGPAVAIVGSRAASRPGMDRAHAIARHLAERGVHVVSGGALGIDGAAHRGALAGGGTTTVVLGSGIDVAYPPRHAALFDAIVAGGGGLVSLLPRGTQPRRHTFLQRNPVIAALADVVVIVEADLRSGSLSTARAARVHARVVCAHPGTAGCDRLLATGAALAESVADVVAALAGAPRTPAPAVAPLDPIAAQIHAAIAGGARSIDQIASATGLPVRAVLRALPVLELARKS